MSEREAARIGDAVLSWLVKYDLADAGNEYRAEDVVAILDDIAPYEEAAEITRLQKELETAREDAARIAEESCTGREIDDMDIGWDAACMVIAEKIRRALKDKEVAG